MQVRLMRQLEAGPSNQSEQNRVPRSVTASTATLSIAKLNQVNELNQALLAGFRQKADANSGNTPLTIDYCFDVLEELAGWLKQQTAYCGMHSLTDLLRHVYAGNHHWFEHIVRDLDKHLTNSGTAPVRMGKPSVSGRTAYADICLIPIISALNLSRREPHITLPPAAISRQDERRLHTYHLALIAQSSDPKVASNYTVPLKHFCIWLQKQKEPGARILHGLDSLEKVLNHPNEEQVKEVLDGFRDHPDTTYSIGDKARTAINKLRNLKGRSLLRVRQRPRAQPTPRQLLPARPEQPANLAPPHTSRLGGPAFVAGATVLPSKAPDEAGSSRHDLRRPAPWLQEKFRNVRPRVDPTPSGQSANLAPTHRPGMAEPDITDEELAFLVGPATTEDEFDFFNKLFK